MKIELFRTAGCSRCAASTEALKAAALAVAAEASWREVDAIEELDYAVELGVLTLPAVAIDQQLVFSSLPSPDQLVKAMQDRLRKTERGR